VPVIDLSQSRNDLNVQLDIVQECQAKPPQGSKIFVLVFVGLEPREATVVKLQTFDKNERFIDYYRFDLNWNLGHNSKGNN
jgi:hypothetical protein